MTGGSHGVLVCLACTEGVEKNVNNLVCNKEKTNDMFRDLGFIMKHNSNDDVDDAIHVFFSKFVDENKFLEYFHKNWVVGDKFRKCTNSPCFRFCLS